jgi:hypothetical protein
MSREQLRDVMDRLDKHFEADLLRRVPGALLENGDQIYIRRVNGNLQWIKANVHGGGQEWEDLVSGGTMRQIELRALLEGQNRINAEKEEKLKALEVGWYQDTKGDLYQFDGTTWLGNVPSRAVIEKLEYLGK